MASGWRAFELQVLATDRSRRQVLGAKQTELIEIGLAHVGRWHALAEGARSSTSVRRRRGGQYSTPL